MKHTPEPWISRGREIGDSPMMLTKISNSISGYSTGEAEANAKRIVECVNACAGMEDPATEITALKAQRDELLQSLEFCKPVLKENGLFELSERTAVDKAEAAIAKVKGNQP